MKSEHSSDFFSGQSSLSSDDKVGEEGCLADSDYVICAWQHMDQA